MDDGFQEIEELFSRLINSFEGKFTTSEIHEVEVLIDVGEYGIALETLIGIVDEEDKKISNDAFALIRKLADEMSMDREALLRKLQK